MKISQARMDFLSEHQSDQMDARLTKKFREEISLNRRRPRSSIQEGQSRQGGLSRILVDQVSISRNQTKDIQSNYSSDIQSRSTITSADSDVSSEFEQHETLEKIVGGIIDKQVTIRQIQRNEDIQMGNDRSGQKEPGDTQVSQTLNRFRRLESQRISQLSLSHTQIHFEAESTAFSSKGQVTTEDGRVIDFSLDMSLERSFLSRTEEQQLIQRWQKEINLTDPLMISLDGKAPVLSDTFFEFDLNNDGAMENINFAGGGSGFLALDKNADNKINNGSELFGPGTGNGFGELAGFDEDQNHWIDENDAVFSQLSVWTKDGDGQDKLISLKDAGIGAIALDYADMRFNMTGSDNQLNGQLRRSGVFLFENGNVGSVHQVDLVSHQIIQEDPAVNLVNDNDALTEPVFAMENISQSRQPDSVQPLQVSGPLQDLLDKIEEMKQKLTSLIEEMNPLYERKKSSERRSYDSFMIDPTLLFFRDRGDVRSRHWTS